MKEIKFGLIVCPKCGVFWKDDFPSRDKYCSDDGTKMAHLKWSATATGEKVENIKLEG